MRVGMVPESFLERLGARLNLIPRPIIDCQGGFMMARAIMVATRIGLFEALRDDPKSAEELAASCGSNPRMTRALANSLIAIGYLEPAGQEFALAPRLRKWLLAEEPTSVRDQILFEYDCWRIAEAYDATVVTGRGVDIHAAYAADEWERYQRGMRATAAGSATELARLIPAPRAPRNLLDIGGSHGLYSVALCRRHPGLAATILDLPQAIDAAAPLLAKEGMSDRVRHQAGDALTDDLGVNRYDIVIMAQLAHHFTAEQNEQLAAKVARALKPNGVFTVIDQIAIGTPAEARKPSRRVGALLDLFFAASSTSGTWSVDDIHRWQQSAGLVPVKTRWTTGFPLGLVSARKAA